MKNTETPSTQFCFPAEAVNEYFTDVMHLQDFAKTIRAYNHRTSLHFMRASYIDEGYIPEEVYKGIEILNNFLEVLSPYFTASNK